VGVYCVGVYCVGVVLWGMEACCVGVGYFSAKRTSVPGMLSDFNLFDLFPQRRAISCTVFTCDSNLLGSGLLKNQYGPLKEQQGLLEKGN
jgi:hypothetical protein